MLWKAPGNGCSQGNSGVSMLWVLISTTLLQALREEGFGMDFKGALSTQQVVFVTYAFVDGTNLIKTASYTWDQFEDVASQMQRPLNLWSGTILATGGALV